MPETYKQKEFTEEDIKTLTNTKDYKDFLESAQKMFNDVQKSIEDVHKEIATNNQYNQEISQMITGDDLFSNSIKMEELSEKISDTYNNMWVQIAATKMIESLKDMQQEWIDKFQENYKKKIIEIWEWFWRDIFSESLISGKGIDHNKTIPNKIIEKEKEGKEYYNLAPETSLLLGMDYIPWWSSSFTITYEMMKEQFDGKVLDYIVEQDPKLSEILTFSTLTCFFKRHKAIDFCDRLETSKPETQNKIIEYMNQHILTDFEFTAALLTSLWEMENFLTNKKEPLAEVTQQLQHIVTRVKEDKLVQKAYELGGDEYLDQSDLFTSKTIKGFMMYDDDENGWWSQYFSKEVKEYRTKYKENQGYQEFHEEDQKYEKCIFQKGDNIITMIRLKTGTQALTQEGFKDICKVNGEDIDYNCFSFRWHCNETHKMIEKACWNNMIGEWDIFIDGWCFNSVYLEEYAKKTKAFPITYCSKWIWAVTDQFVGEMYDKALNGGNFSDILKEYQNIKNNDKYDPECLIQWNEKFDPKVYAAKKMVFPNDITACYAKLYYAQKTEKDTES